MEKIVDFLQSFGWLLVDYAVMPLLLWTVVTGGVMYLLNKMEAIPPAIHYYGRIALIIALPVGIIGSWLTDFISTTFAVSAPLTIFVIDNPLSAPFSSSTSSSLLQDPVIWLGMAGILLVCGFLFYSAKIFAEFINLRRLNKNLQFNRLAEYGDFSDLKRIYGIRSREILLAFSRQISLAFTYGWWNPKVVIPDFLKGNNQKMKMVLHHELMHIKHGDFLLNGIVVWIKAIFWFHPFVNYLYNAVREYREILCDTEVLSGKRNFSRKQYALLIFELAQKKGQAGIAMSMAESNSSLKNRIKMITRRPHSQFGTTGSLFISLATALLLIFLLSFSDISSDKMSVAEIERLLARSQIQQNMSNTSPFYLVDGEKGEMNNSNTVELQKLQSRDKSSRKVNFIVKKEKIDDIKQIKPEYITSTYLLLEDEPLEQIKKRNVNVPKS